MHLITPPSFENYEQLTKIGSSLEDIYSWLENQYLVREGRGYERTSEADDNILFLGHPLLGLPCARVERINKNVLNEIKNKYGNKFTEVLGNTEADWQNIWREIYKPQNTIRHLDVHRIPVDAIAFYRPFHIAPFKEWGIYIVIDRLLNYSKHLRASFGPLKTITEETLMVAVLFEVFHHEFFHHLVESTATALEILYAGIGQQYRLYLDYWENKYEEKLGQHPHKPLEEALANAYAYNSFSFISRVNAGYINGCVQLYQEALKKSWIKEPPGYREAENYIKGGQIMGAAQLLAMLLGSSSIPETVPLLALAEYVFPKGHTAFAAKPDIPTYLVGTPDDLATFYNLVPAPNEAYTKLFWPGDTKKLDDYLQKKRKEAIEEKKKASKNKQLIRGHR